MGLWTGDWLVCMAGSRAPEEVVVIVRNQPALGQGSEGEVSLPVYKARNARASRIEKVQLM